MRLSWVREHCLSFPHVAETVQWENDLVFKIGGKMFAVTCLEPAPIILSFKCSPEAFDQLVERPGVVPAPYLARAKWVGLENEDAVPRAELKRLLRAAYEQVLAKLPRKARAQLAG
jgi:predicted DNA-binding protein (MmcQ/YjbR family)